MMMMTRFIRVDMAKLVADAGGCHPESSHSGCRLSGQPAVLDRYGNWSAFKFLGAIVTMDHTLIDSLAS